MGHHLTRQTRCNNASMYRPICTDPGLRHSDKPLAAYNKRSFVYSRDSWSDSAEKRQPHTALTSAHTTARTGACSTFPGSVCVVVIVNGSGCVVVIVEGSVLVTIFD